MKAWINVGGKLSEPVTVENELKQGDIPAPNLFALNFSIVFGQAFKNCNPRIYIRYRSKGRLFNIRWFDANSKVHLSLIRD